MDFTPDPNVDLDGAVDVTLAGQAFRVPMLPLRQTIKIVGMTSEINGALKDIADAVPLSDDRLMSIVRLIHAGLSRAYPELTLEVLLDLPIGLDELLPAMTSVMGQTRSLRKAAPGEASAAIQ